MWASSAALAPTPEDRRELERLVRSGGSDGAEQRVASNGLRWATWPRTQICEQRVSREVTHDIPPDVVLEIGAATFGAERPAVIWHFMMDRASAARSFSPLDPRQGAEITPRRRPQPVQATQWSMPKHG